MFDAFPMTCDKNVLSLRSFEILAYTDKDVVVPEMWCETHEHKILNEQNVPFRSFTTSIHKVDSGCHGTYKGGYGHITGHHNDQQT
ncbi:hypothetical protein A3Q56_06610 [Intoshia linei]|uniref:Uncharacterized protein n=1 Tax=Intoshia linei TaxID=1819745 RepID=A0A177AWV7_9BILA|nr:hypothetical protein A3Q56_06610 [Intoshia linei]